MLSYILIWTLVLVLGTILCFKILKSVLKTVAIALFIFLLFFITTLTLVYSDVQGLKEDFSEGKNIYILEENDEVLFAVGILQEENNTKSEYQEVSMSNEELSIALKKEDYKDIQESGAYNKIIVIKKEVYAPIQESSGLWTLLENKKTAFSTQANAFLGLNAQLIEQEGFAYLLQEYKKENIDIYPISLFFQVLSFVPESWIASLV